VPSPAPEKEILKVSKSIKQWTVGVASFIAACLIISNSVQACRAKEDAHINALIDAKTAPLVSAAMLRLDAQGGMVKYMFERDSATEDFRIWKSGQDCLDAELRGDPCHGGNRK